MRENDQFIGTPLPAGEVLGGKDNINSPFSLLFQGSPKPRNQDSHREEGLLSQALWGHEHPFGELD